MQIIFLIHSEWHDQAIINFRTNKLNRIKNNDQYGTFIIEDNGISVLTETRKVWNTNLLRFEETKNSKIKSYKYKSKFPHAGAGVRVQF